MSEDYDDALTDFRVKMETFMRGEWTLEAPTEPGSYPICARDTNPGFCVNTVYYSPFTHKIKSTMAWGGWWWSEPLPEMPPPPDLTDRDG